MLSLRRWSASTVMSTVMRVSTSLRRFCPPRELRRVAASHCSLGGIRDRDQKVQRLAGVLAWLDELEIPRRRLLTLGQLLFSSTHWLGDNYTVGLAGGRSPKH